MQPPPRPDSPSASAASPGWLRHCRVREPFNGLSHLAGALLAAAGLLFLVAVSLGKPVHLAGLAVYGGSLVLLYTASTLYHSLPVGPRQVQRLLMWDQVAIYLLIAGTYTPLCLVPLRGPWGYGLLGTVWAIALVGILLRVGWRRAPGWLPFALYLLMGWLCVVALAPLGGLLSPEGLAWLFAGGMAYTVGALILILDRPCFRPGVFGAHELWHCFVLAGSACHFVLMLRVVVPAA